MRGVLLLILYVLGLVLLFNRVWIIVLEFFLVVMCRGVCFCEFDVFMFVLWCIKVRVIIDLLCLMVVMSGVLLFCEW